METNRCRMQFGSRCLSPVADCTTRQREKKKRAPTLILASSKWGGGGTHPSGSAFVETQEHRGCTAAGSRCAALPRAGIAAGRGASRAGSQGSAELQQSLMHGSCPLGHVPGPCSAGKGRAEPHQGLMDGGRAPGPCPAGTGREPQPGDAGTRRSLRVVPQLTQKEPTATLGNKTE